MDDNATTYKSGYSSAILDCEEMLREYVEAAALTGPQVAKLRQYLGVLKEIAQMPTYDD